MMIPEPWWSAGAEPGRAVKLGRRDSAMFIRKVPEPQRQRAMRAAKSAATASFGTMRS